jgi:hypothetical protein
MKCLEKYWPMRTAPTVLVTDYLYDRKMWEGEYTLVHNNDHGWCQNLIKGLDQLKQFRTFLMMQEDFFLTDTPDADFISYAVRKILENRDIGCFRLYPCPGADLDIGEKRYGLISKKAPYQVSCQASIWNPYYLMKCLGQGHHPWQFELFGSRYAETSGISTLAVKRDSPKPYPIEYICTAIVSGKWQQGALDHCKSLGIYVDTTLRPIV